MTPNMTPNVSENKLIQKKKTAFDEKSKYSGSVNGNSVQSMGQFSSVGMMFRCLGGSSINQGPLMLQPGFNTTTFGQKRESVSDYEKVGINRGRFDSQSTKKDKEETKPRQLYCDESPAVNSSKVR
jgi:hypothetical protein